MVPVPPGGSEARLTSQDRLSALAKSRADSGAMVVCRHPMNRSGRTRIAPEHTEGRRDAVALGLCLKGVCYYGIAAFQMPRP